MFILVVVILFLAVAIAVTPAFHAFIFKFNKYRDSLKYMIWNKDIAPEFHGSNCIHVGTMGPEHNGTQKIRILFIRHGQSVWNSIYSEVNMGLPIRLMHSLFLEIKYFFTKPLDSQLIDTPLSAKGIKQAKDLANFVRGAEGKIGCDTTTSVVLCSNLRRTMQTALIGLSPRLSLTGEKIVVDSSLQEGSGFVDTQSFSTEIGKIAPMTFSGFENPEKLQNMLDPRLNKGNKTLALDLNTRMDSFLLHIFGGTIVPPTAGDRGAKDLKEIIVVGHSLLFREFFRRFLPRSSSHISKRCTMQNCGVVAFDLLRNVSTGEVVIDENSINVLYKGFIKA